MVSTEQLNALALGVNTNVEVSATTDESKFIEKFTELWPVVKEVLSIVKLITGTTVDKIIDQVIEVGDVISGQTPGDKEKALDKFTEVWSTVSSPVNHISKIIPGKAGKVIRAFISLADAFTENYQQSHLLQPKG